MTVCVLWVTLPPFRHEYVVIPYKLSVSAFTVEVRWGETLSVTIAITNTRSLQAHWQVVPPRSTQTHKRSAHSVRYA